MHCLIDDRCNRFKINQATGVISVKRDLNLTENSLKHLYGVCPITVIVSIFFHTLFIMLVSKEMYKIKVRQE